MMEIDNEEFQKRLKQLCKENFKVDAILKRHNYNFEEVHKIQQELILEVLGLKIEKITKITTV